MVSIAGQTQKVNGAEGLKAWQRRRIMEKRTESGLEANTRKGRIRMKIVVLDGYTLCPGDLSLQALRELGEVTVYDRT